MAAQTRTEPDGLLRMLTMPYDMFTIGVGDDRPVTIRAQAVACDALQAMAHMAGHLNKAEDATFYEQWLDADQAGHSRQAVASGVLQHEPRFPGAFQRLGQLLGDPGRAVRRPAGEFDLPRNRQAVHRDRLPGTASAGTSMGRHRPVRLPKRRHVCGSTGADPRAANKTQDSRLLGLTLFEFRRILQRWKCFPVTIHPWNADSRGGVDESHSASALVAILMYGVAGVEEGPELRFRPLMVPEVGNHIEIRDLLYRNTRFHVRIKVREPSSAACNWTASPCPSR